MHRLRVYVDNSVFGGVYDDEFADASQRVFSMAKQGDFTVLISQIVLDEISDAPENVQAVLHELPGACLEEIVADQEALDLAQAYIHAGAIGEAHMSDAIQIAAASLARADLILSWNFRHIVNYDRIHKYNAVNMLNGYPQIDIRSPLEVVYGEEE